MKQSHANALQEIRKFLTTVNAYDVLPVSFKLVMLDTSLSLKSSLLTMIQNGIISVPLWDSKHSRFAGLLTAADYIDAIHFYARQPETVEKLDSANLEMLDEIKQSVGAAPVSRSYIGPDTSLMDACAAIVESKAHRIPIVDIDKETNHEFVVSVLTQYRVLRFVALNCKQTQDLLVPVSEIGVISRKVQTATIQTSIIDAAAMFSEHAVSCLPVLDHNGKLCNVYESYDLLTLVKSGNFASSLALTVGEALMRRPEEFEGVLTCAETDTLADIVEIIRRTRVLRLCVVDQNGDLCGIITLSDILRYILQG